ncbi:DUF2845 domain-containing protein [Alteromonas sediminis]|uniref:DUF2845 domain-containing protein n=1 Tax=Alteromonas sediminis TaxID=2259342 RepID=A0A3N5Y3J9_9ALTE|nr:DUF2845 domain-containing protein [Alteromonas sediminis]RPJ68627.1 DUF2845 domain-containing protein [Alteromonas sediminis]
MKIVFAILLSTSLSLLSQSAHAMRCNSRLAMEGDSSFHFKKICGEPAHIERHTVYRSRSVHQNTKRLSDRGNVAHKLGITHAQEVAIHVEIWTYNFGPNRFMREVRFENGVAKSIQLKGKGY